jgi:hypothetical protein
MGDEHQGEQEAASRRAARRRKALDEVFGDVLPGTTQDESAETGRRRRSPDATSDDRDDEIQRDVPPHHS